MYAATALQLPVVNAQRGLQIQRRRLTLGIPSVNAFAKELRMDRQTLTRAEAGQASERTYQRLEAWLSDKEHEFGMDSPNVPAAADVQVPSDDLVEFRVGGNFGVDVVVRGPIANLGELEQAVGRLLDKLRSEDGGGGTGNAAAG